MNTPITDNIHQEIIDEHARLTKINGKKPIKLSLSADANAELLRSLGAKPRQKIGSLLDMEVSVHESDLLVFRML